MTNKVPWSTVMSRATSIAKKLDTDTDKVAQELKRSLEANGFEIDYGDELDFTSQKVDRKKASPS